MGVHRLVAGIRRVAGVFTGIQEVREGLHRLLRNTAGGQGFGDVLLALVGHVHGQFVRNEADEGPVKFLIEGRIEILVQEITSQFEPLERLAGRLAVSVADDIGPACGQFPEGQPYGGRGKQQQAHEDPVGGFAHEEALVLRQGGLGLDETDVLAQVLHPLAVHRQGTGTFRRCLGSAAGAPLHGQMQRIRRSGRITAVLHVEIGEAYRCERELARAARNEGVLEGLGSVRAALVGGRGGFHVIHLEIRREIDLRRFHQGNIALAGHGDDQRGRIVRLQGILAQFRTHVVLAYRTGESGRGAAGKGGDLDVHGRGHHPLTLRDIVVLEEIVEDGAGPRPCRPDIHEADDLGRVDGQGASLLRDEDPAAEEGGVVHLVAHLFALEFDALRGIHLLAPETVELRELGILEARQVRPLVDLEGGGDGLAHDGLPFAQAQPHEDLAGIGRPRRTGFLASGRAARLGGTTALGGCSRLATAFHDRHLGGPGTDLRSLDRRRSGGQLERAGLLGLENIRVGGLGRLGCLAVDDGNAGGTSLLRAPDESEIIPGTPLEIGRGMLSVHDEDDIEPFTQFHDIMDLHPDGLCPSGKGHHERREGGYPSFHRPTNSFLSGGT